jgi:hypothetical protein
MAERCWRSVLRIAAVVLLVATGGARQPTDATIVPPLRETIRQLSEAGGRGGRAAPTNRSSPASADA